MKITIQRTESKEIEIITPAYYRINAREVLAIFDENNFVSAFQSENLTIVKSNTLKHFDDFKYLKDENITTETDFFECYNKAHAALSLLPKYSESDEIENGSQEGEDWQDRMNDHAETELHNYGN